MLRTESCAQCEHLLLSGAMPGTPGAVCPACLMKSLFDSQESARAPADLLIGRELGGHVLVGLLGQGGMGVVYRARQRGLDRYVALKVLNPAEEARTEDVRRFVGEARSAAKLSHPNIVPVHEVGQDAGFHYFTMDLVEGMSLAERLLEGPLPPREAAGIVAKTARAIHAAHERGIIHRDLKPSNVLLAGGEPKVTDFGLAKDLTRLARVTRSGAVMGTPSYMAPEQARGEAADARTDVYGLGAVLYECLTGWPPFGGRDVAETLTNLLRDDPAPIGRDRPRDLEVICRKALAKEPERRYATAAELADDLERHLRDEPILARPEGMLARARRRVRRNPWAWTLAAVATGALALGGGLLAHNALRAKAEPARIAGAAHAAVQEVQDKRERALRHVEAARRLNAQAQYLDARTEADEALAIDPECAEAWYEAGYAQEHTGEMEAAREAYDQAVLFRPGWNEAHYRRVLSRVTYGDLDSLTMFMGFFPIPDVETVRDSLEALQRWEAVPEYRHTVAAIVAIAGDEWAGEEVLAELDRATQANPRHADAWFLKGLAWLLRSREGNDPPEPGEEIANRRQKALEALQRGLELEPTRVQTYMLMTYLHYENRDLIAAMECAERPVEIAPDRPESYLVRALARMLLRQRDLALEDVDTAIRMNAGSALPYIVRVLVQSVRVESWGMSRMISGDLLPDLDRAIELDPEFPPAYLWRAEARMVQGDREGTLQDIDTLRRVSARSSMRGYYQDFSDVLLRNLDERPREADLFERGMRAWQNQRWDELDALADEILAQYPEGLVNPPWGNGAAISSRALAAWTRAVAARGRGDLPTATRRLREAIDEGLPAESIFAWNWEEVDDPVVVAWVRTAPQSVDPQLEELETRVRELEQALAGLPADSPSRADAQEWLAEARTSLLEQLGARALFARDEQHWSEMDRLADRIVAASGNAQEMQLLGDHSLAPSRAVAAWIRAVAAQGRGDLPTATRHLLEAIEAGLPHVSPFSEGWEDVDDPAIPGWRQGPVANFMARAGHAIENEQWDEVDALAEEVLVLHQANATMSVDGLPEDVDPRPIMAAWMRALAARGRGDLPVATRHLRGAIEAGLPPREFLVEGWQEFDDPVIRAWVERTGQNP